MSLDVPLPAVWLQHLHRLRLERVREVGEALAGRGQGEGGDVVVLRLVMGNGSGSMGVNGMIWSPLRGGMGRCRFAIR